jgi:hypothetical protein
VAVVPTSKLPASDNNLTVEIAVVDLYKLTTLETNPLPFLSDEVFDKIVLKVEPA